METGRLDAPDVADSIGSGGDSSLDADLADAGQDAGADSGGDAPRVEGWHELPTRAKDIDIAPDGTVWLVTAEAEVGGPGYRLARMLPSDSMFQPLPGGAIRIAAGPAGTAWTVMNARGDLQRWARDKWVGITGGANDVAVGAQGQVWIVGTLPPGPVGQDLYSFSPVGEWNLEGTRLGKRLAVDASGDVWLVDGDGALERRSSGAWEVLPERASNVAAGADGTVCITDFGDPEADGYPIRCKRPGEADWRLRPGFEGRALAVDPTGRPWAANRSGTLKRWVD